MRLWFSALFFGLGLAQPGSGLVRSAKDPQVLPIYPIGTKNETFAKPAGTLFEIDGKVSYFAGTNAWWLSHLSKNEDVDIAMKQIADTKYKIIRVWGFADVIEPPADSMVDPKRVWYQLHNESGPFINYGSDGLQRLDYVVSTAERLGLKLVLPFVNYWPDLGGMDYYAFAYGYKPDFYRNNRSQEVYRDYIRVVVERYRRSPAIFAWQLANEPRCPVCDTSVIVAWATDVSRYIKSLDPHHMVSLGDEGWFGPTSGYTDHGDALSFAYTASDGVDFVENLNISTLDYGTFHLYPSLWGYAYEWGDQWITQHADAGIRFNKPVILEEYGSPVKGNHRGVLAPWQETMLKARLAADQVWQFGPSNLSFDSLDFGDEFSIYYDHPEFEQLGKQHAQAMLDKKV